MGHRKYYIIYAETKYLCFAIDRCPVPTISIHSQTETESFQLVMQQINKTHTTKRILTGLRHTNGYTLGLVIFGENH